MIFPKVSRTYVGLTTSFFCNSSWFTAWFFSRQKIFPQNNITFTIMDFDRLTIKYVNLTNTGYYFCFGTYPRSSTYYIAMAELLVYGMLTLML